MLTREQARSILDERYINVSHMNLRDQNNLLDGLIEAYNQGYNDGYASAVAHTPLFL